MHAEMKKWMVSVIQGEKENKLLFFVKTLFTTDHRVFPKHCLVIGQSGYIRFCIIITDIQYRYVYLSSKKKKEKRSLHTKLNQGTVQCSLLVRSPRKEKTITLSTIVSLSSETPGLKIRSSWFCPFGAWNATITCLNTRLISTSGAAGWNIKVHPI